MYIYVLIFFIDKQATDAREHARILSSWKCPSANLSSAAHQTSSRTWRRWRLWWRRANVCICALLRLVDEYVYRHKVYMDEFVHLVSLALVWTAQEWRNRTTNATN